MIHLHFPATEECPRCGFENWPEEHECYNCGWEFAISN